METKLKQIIMAMHQHPASIKAIKQFIEIESRLIVLSKKYEKPIEELWSDFNKMHTFSMYPFNVVLNDIEMIYKKERENDGELR